MIVSDSTPLIAFARIGELELLRRVVDQLIVPQAVWEELTAATNRAGAAEIQNAAWIGARAVESVSPDLLQLLDRGEAEVILLAELIDADEVVLDERAARAVALSRGLRIVGTAGLLVRAKHRRLIPTIRPLIERMQIEGIRYSDRFVAELLRQAGE
jgi:hypothetical protein